MDFRVKVLADFKDGNVMGGRFLKAGEILVVTPLEKQRIEQSGGELEVIENVIKNPVKAFLKGHDDQKEEPVEAQVEEKQSRGKKNDSKK
jgi:hypothetical protein